MGRARGARIAFENSIKLLKTATALRHLGQYALRDGNYAQAKTYLKQAAESDTKEGRAAFAELLRIDLPSNAGAYLDASIALNDSGQVLFVIKNNTPFPIGNVVVEVSDNTGSRRMSLSGVIQPNSETSFNMIAHATQREVDNSSIRVISARLAGVAGL